MRKDEEQKAVALINRFWEKLLEQEPLLATTVGDERYDHRMPDPSETGLAQKKSLYEKALAELRQLHRDRLNPDTLVTLDILEFAAQRALEYISYQTDRFMAASHFYGPGELFAFIGVMQRADTPERIGRYVRRLLKFPAYLDAFGATALEALYAGQTQPALVVDRAIAQVERLLQLKPEASPGMMPVASASTEDKTRVAQVIKEEVWPAYSRYLRALKIYRHNTRESIGLCALPNGEALYANRILNFTTLPLDPRKVHELGCAQLENIQRERQRIAKRLGYRDAAAAIAVYTAQGRNTAQSREELLRLAEEQVQRSWDAAPAFFGRLPKENCLVLPIAEFHEKDNPAGMYITGSGDSSRRGVYMVNTSDLAQRPLHDLAAVTYHEANPGHHFQISIAQEFTDRLPFRRFASWFVGSAFVEGWALYCERLADEMGLYLNDYERLGMLEAHAWRACRLIVDTGIHAFGWTREQAIAKLQESGTTRLNAEVETDRYIAWPGQALAYMVGQLEIQRVRHAAAQRAGKHFSLRNFHDKLLALGPVPLEVLKREMLP